MTKMDSIGQWIESTTRPRRISSNNNTTNNNFASSSNNTLTINSNSSNSNTFSDQEDSFNLKRAKTTNRSKLDYEEERIEYHDANSFEGYSALANSLGLLHLFQTNSMDSTSNSNQEDDSEYNSSRSHNSSYSILSYAESITTPPVNSTAASPQLLPIHLPPLFSQEFSLEPSNFNNNFFNQPPTSPLNTKKTLLELPSTSSNCASSSLELTLLHGHNSIHCSAFNLPSSSSSSLSTTPFSFATFEYSPSSTSISSTSIAKRPIISPNSALLRSNHYATTAFAQLPSPQSSLLSLPQIASTSSSCSEEYSECFDSSATKRRRTQ